MAVVFLEHKYFRAVEHAGLCNLVAKLDSKINEIMLKKSSTYLHVLYVHL